MAYFLIDFENVKSDGMTGITKLSAEDKVCIFYSEKADSLSFGMHKQLNETLAEVTYRKVEVGTRNALDFQLATCLGFLVANTLAEGRTNECFYVVSKDTGYVSLENYWKKNQKAKSAGIEVKRVTSIAAAVKLKKAENMEAAETSVQPEKVQVSKEVADKQEHVAKEVTEQQTRKEAVAAKIEAGAASATEETVFEVSQVKEGKESAPEPKEKPKKKKKSKLQHAEEKEKAAEKKKKQVKKRKLPKAEHEDRMVNERLLGERIIGMYPETKEDTKPQVENLTIEKQKKKAVDAEAAAEAEKQKRNSVAETSEAVEQQKENPDAETIESVKKQKRNPDAETTESIKKQDRKLDSESTDSTARPKRKPASERKAKFKVRIERSGKKSDHPEKRFHRKPENSQEQSEPVAEKPVTPAPSEDGFSMVIREQNFVSSALADLSKYHVDEDFSKVKEQTHVANYHPGEDALQMKIETKGSGNQTIEQKQVVLSEQEENKN